MLFQDIFTNLVIQHMTQMINYVVWKIHNKKQIGMDKNNNFVIAKAHILVLIGTLSAIVRHPVVYVKWEIEVGNNFYMEKNNLFKIV
ncbi:hypothetical protein BpHYR1_020547 [Brachionus plicatilis]|uniref:Uncharacterized protein n=1 Tax=Brachionus plicatilis TaxID=10195 RepID=A0A3M7S7S6_BRAPC|nr:hypothetical protein BpHYR1_020547 [Brachionus plicatilis]